jgi:dihydropteroate synthase
MNHADFESWLRGTHRSTLVMGVLNVTPDSFSDGGKFLDPAGAVAHAQEMLAQGADLVDIGGESTRPGSQRIFAAEQIRRVEPVIRALRKASDVLISIDTSLAAVARAAMDAGANIINDISAAREDPAMLPLAAERAAPIILMHMQGTPATMQQNPTYHDVTAEVRWFLLERAQAAEQAGVQRQRILVDPGIGFGKTFEHNLVLLRNTRYLADSGFPVVIGTSRKRFIEGLTGVAEPERRVFGTAATVAWSAANGAAIVRVHDVEPMVQVVRVIRSIQSAEA